MRLAIDGDMLCFAKLVVAEKSSQCSQRQGRNKCSSFEKILKTMSPRKQVLAQVITSARQSGSTNGTISKTFHLFPAKNNKSTDKIKTIAIRGTGILAQIIAPAPTCRRNMSYLAASSTTPNNETDELSQQPTIEIYNALPLGCVDYNKSWAWQHTLLSKRLAHRRSASGKEAADCDCLLLLEHAPVYTLGRGSDQAHITFLNSPSRERERQQLSRQGSARLVVDRQSDNVVGKLSTRDAIRHLSKLATPVIAPNGVPIFRVERGGEVTWHGPSQLVVYPLLDLKHDCYKQDLHWYLRMVEQVVIETLAEYGIEGQRDDENTGKRSLLLLRIAYHRFDSH